MALVGAEWYRKDFPEVDELSYVLSSVSGSKDFSGYLLNEWRAGIAESDALRCVNIFPRKVSWRYDYKF